MVVVCIYIKYISGWLDPQPALRVWVRQGSENLNLDPYPSLPYPKPVVIPMHGLREHLKNLVPLRKDNGGGVFNGQGCTSKLLER